MESYHETINRTSGNRPLRPFEYVATPPIQHVLDAITGYCRIGGSFAPGIRQLGEMSGVALGAISGCLYELDRLGWISYDGHVIMVLRDQTDHAVEVPPDQSDHAVEVPPTDHAHDRGFEASGSGDQNSDRFDHDMVLTSNKNLDSESLVTYLESRIPCGTENDHATDIPPAARLMAELGANPKIIRDAFIKRPDWTPQQVRDRWDYDQKRIAADPERVHVGVFFAALRRGELAPAAGALDPLAYASRDGFALGGAPPPSPDEPETIRDRAIRLCGDWTADNHREKTRDCGFLQGQLSKGDTDDQALVALAEYRKTVKR